MFTFELCHPCAAPCREQEVLFAIGSHQLEAKKAEGKANATTQTLESNLHDLRLKVIKRRLLEINDELRF